MNAFATLRTATIALAVGALLGSLGGYRLAAGNCARVELKTVVATQAAAVVTGQAAASATEAGAADSARVAANLTPITREVIRYVETHPAAADCRLDPDGLQLWSAANAGRLAQPAGSGHAAGADAAPADLGQPAGSADESRGRDAGLSPAGAAPSQPGALAAPGVADAGGPAR